MRSVNSYEGVGSCGKYSAAGPKTDTELFDGCGGRQGRDGHEVVGWRCRAEAVAFSVWLPEDGGVFESGRPEAATLLRKPGGGAFQRPGVAMRWKGRGWRSVAKAKGGGFGREAVSGAMSRTGRRRCVGEKTAADKAFEVVRGRVEKGGLGSNKFINSLKNKDRPILNNSNTSRLGLPRFAKPRSDVAAYTTLEHEI